MNELIRKSEQIYALLLKLYPRAYQRQFGEEMQYVFSETLKDEYGEKGSQGIISHWCRIFADTGKSLIIQHFENQNGKDTMKSKNTLQKSMLRVGLVVAAILLIPFIGTQVSAEWDWELFDFVIMGVLLFSIGMLIEFVRQKVKNTTHRAILIIGLVLLCLYIWAELAVGVFTNLGS